MASASLVVTLVSGAFLFLADRFTGGSGVAGLAAASTAGNAAAVPALVAIANPAYADAAGPATVLISASVVTTAIVVPLLTAWWAARHPAKDCWALAPSAAAERTHQIQGLQSPCHSRQDAAMKIQNRKVRWGSLGYAKIAFEHLIPAIQQLEQF